MAVVGCSQWMDRLCDRSHSCRLHIVAYKLQPGSKSGVRDQAQAIVVNVPLMTIQKCLHG